MDHPIIYGRYLEKYILDFANLVTERGSAGIVSAIILSLLLFLIVTYGLDFFTRIKNIKRFEGIIKSSTSDTDFKEKFDTINEKIR